MTEQLAAVPFNSIKFSVEEPVTYWYGSGSGPAPLTYRSRSGSAPLTAFSSVADQMPTKSKFFSNLFLLITLVVGTFTSVFKEKSQKEVQKY